MPHDQRISLLISLKLSGEASPEELKELERLINENPELLERIEAIKKLWKQLDRHSTGRAEESFEKHLHRLNEKLFESDTVSKTQSDVQKLSPVRRLLKKNYYRMLGVAAAASILLFWFLFRTNENTGIKPIENAISTKAGDKASINLPDGSKVWLNGDSKLTYVGDFGNKTREVYLSGEAFFDVAKDKTKPFIIHTRTINLKVLGTAFNVRSYDYEKETETALVHGSLEVTLRNRPDQKIFLKPGEKLLVKNILVDTVLNFKKQKHDEETPIAVLTNMRYYGTDSSTIETSWTKNQLVFTNEPLDKIALNLERWFNVQVTITDESLKQEKYTGTIEEDDKLKDFLEALKLAEGIHFHYSIKNDEVVITR
ncbi:MAG: FecR domain-containing protein [Bacteroidia bacterium]|nr:FecR domain-containing protein [Bacteroidia bacterium]